MHATIDIITRRCSYLKMMIMYTVIFIKIGTTYMRTRSRFRATSHFGSAAIRIVRLYSLVPSIHLFAAYHQPRLSAALMAKMPPKAPLRRRQKKNALLKQKTTGIDGRERACVSVVSIRPQILNLAWTRRRGLMRSM